MDTNLPSAKYSAWDPGLDSQLPREYLPLSTIFRAENVSTSAAKADELSDFCGLPPEELVAFRVERLIVHELLIHVTTGIAVPDGRNDEDLARVFEQLKHNASVIIAAEIANAFQPKIPVTADESGHSRWLFGFNKPKKSPPPPSETVAESDQRIVSAWLEQSHKTGDR